MRSVRGYARDIRRPAILDSFRYRAAYDSHADNPLTIRAGAGKQAAERWIEMAMMLAYIFLSVGN